MRMKILLNSILAGVLVAGTVGAGVYFISLSRFDRDESADATRDPLFGWKFPVVTGPDPVPVETARDPLFGWKYPVALLPNVGPTPDRKIAYSDIRDPGGIPQGLPIRLKIPAIGVDSAIEDAFITPEGRMDVPSGSKNVAWFALGPNPGRAGSAVIGGHFGISNGVPFVFYDLDKLVVGDEIYIEDDDGNTLAFQVRRIELFGRNDDATTVFTSDDGLSHLNLITCEGIWNRVNDTYPQRRVVFADKIQTGNIIGGPAIATFSRSIGIGAEGADVIALQTILEEKGFLVIPQEASKGYFGILTRDAVAKYQTSAGLSPVGVFGPLTRAKLVAELLVPAVAIKPSFPATSAVSPVLNSRTISSSIKSLYATPVDGLITSLLLILIIFMVFKIKRSNFLTG